MDSLHIMIEVFQMGKNNFISPYYTRSSDSAPSICAILGAVLIEKLTKSSISALFLAYL